jgi:hypothetical protein
MTPTGHVPILVLPGEEVATPGQRSRILTKLDDLDRKGTATSNAGGDKINITIHPAPGMDEAALAELVIRKLEERRRRLSRPVLA